MKISPTLSLSFFLWIQIKEFDNRTNIGAAQTAKLFNLPTTYIMEFEIHFVFCNGGEVLEINTFAELGGGNGGELKHFFGTEVGVRERILVGQKLLSLFRVLVVSVK